MDVKEILSVEDAAEFLGISPYTVRKHARQGLIPGRKVGREWRFSRDSLLEWLGCGLSRDDLAAVRRGIEDISVGRVVSWETLGEELGRE
ncbi:MAG: helix-turn-helix domain-containing protein [Actinobacteria bacterium]|nr:helix-turn-helix domain-containing protein [Actinomycetota bacterium]MBU4240579.1 helix-turn-helix domain-containing protein [Actinomycetota bacterium]MBU4489232.1 helix-turn-helix domain-containing protein [Actinomycetota bacterium]